MRKPKRASLGQGHTESQTDPVDLKRKEKRGSERGRVERKHQTAEAHRRKGPLVKPGKSGEGDNAV